MSTSTESLYPPESRSIESRFRAQRDDVAAAQLRTERDMPKLPSVPECLAWRLFIYMQLSEGGVKCG